MANEMFKMAEDISHPVIQEAVQKYCPKGFKPLRQMRHTKTKVISRFKEQYGAANVRIEKGHFELQFSPRSHMQVGEHYFAEFRKKDGCMIFVREEILDPKKTKHRLVPGTSREASDPDWNTPCIYCGAVPTEQSTKSCGPCLWGEASTDEGNW